MYLHSTLLTAASLILALGSAMPTTLDTRDDHPTDIWTCGVQCDHTVFDPDQATCGGAKHLQNLKNDVTVVVQPDCDKVIDTICKAADKLGQASKPPTFASMTYAWGTCRADMLFSAGTSGSTDLNYDACVKAYQGISESCMLNVKAANQFGVQNVDYQGAGGDLWTASTQFLQTTPGYLLGPNLGPTKTVWGATNWQGEKEATDV